MQKGGIVARKGKRNNNETKANELNSQGSAELSMKFAKGKEGVGSDFS